MGNSLRAGLMPLALLVSAEFAAHGCSDSGADDTNAPGGPGPGCSAVEAAYLDPVPSRPFKVSSSCPS